MESKQKTPSVIAKLMGLDELAPQQPLHRQYKVLSDDYRRKTASIGRLEKRSLRDVRLCKISPEQQEKYFCGSEIPDIDSQIMWPISDDSENPGMVRGDFSFLRQRNSHAKNLSKDMKLHHLKGLDDVPGHLCTNASLGYYHHPNLSIKQFGDPKELRPCVPSGQLPASMSTSVSDDSDSGVCKKLGNVITPRIVLRSPQKLDQDSGRTSDPLDKCEPQLDLKDRSVYSSRRIVLLKPNSRQGKLNIERPEAADTTNVMEPPRHSYRVTRVAPKSTQAIKKNTGSSCEGFPRSKITAEKSSPIISEKISCQSSFDCKGRDRISYPFPSGSLFTMEAKKQIFERWKSTKSFQEVEEDDRRCTLGEMFVMHNGGVRTKTSNVKNSQFSHESKQLYFGSPLSIGKYGSKEKYMGNLPRLELFKRSSTATENCNKTVGGASQNGVCPGHRDCATEGSNNSKNKASNINDSLEPTVPRSNHEKKKYGADLKINHDIDENTIQVDIDENTIQDDSNFNWDKMDINGEAEHRPITASNLSTKGLAHVNSTSHSKAEAAFSSEDQLLEIAQSILPVGEGHSHASSDVWEDLIPQRSSFDFANGELGSSSTIDPNLAVNIKEINQYSPNSVLEPLFKEGNPFASEFYNSPHTDLSGLAMKLELLNSKSEETNSECSGMNVSSDEDNEKRSVDVPQYDKKLWGMSKPEESRDFSYLVDVLDESNLTDGNLDNLYETWHSMEFPVSPSLFETLEKKYGRQTSWLKSDRRLLFDRINSGLKEILASYMFIQISTKPLRRRCYSTLRMDEIEEELWMLLLNQEKEASKDLSEMKWLELGEDISIICREIEEDLFNELAAEVD